MKTNLKRNQEAGFTLIEILVVIGIIAVLAAIVLVAINPARQFSQARDTERRSNTTAILDAVGQYIADNQGELPPSIAGLTAGDPAEPIGDGDVDLCTDLLGDYLPAFPVDPQDGSGDGADVDDCTTYDSGYEVALEDTGRVTISAPGAELDTISVTR